MEFALIVILFVLPSVTSDDVPSTRVDTAAHGQDRLAMENRANALGGSDQIASIKVDAGIQPLRTQEESNNEARQVDVHQLLNQQEAVVRGDVISGSREMRITAPKILNLSPIPGQRGNAAVSSQDSSKDSDLCERITDLQLKQYDPDDYTEGIVAEFTTSSHNSIEARVKRYEFRYTFDDPTSLARHFERSKRINASNILVQPIPALEPTGEKYLFMIESPQLPIDQSGNVINGSRLAVSVRVLLSTVDTPNCKHSNIAVINLITTLAASTFDVTTDTAASGAMTASEDPTTILSTEVFTLTSATIKSEDSAKTTTAKLNPATTTTSMTTTSPCQECENCDQRIYFFTWLSSGLGIIAAIFLTSTVILSIWLWNTNKQLAMIGASDVQDGDNIKMTETLNPSKKSLWFPTIQPTKKEIPQDNTYVNDFDF